jgi:hypothetical protein
MSFFAIFHTSLGFMLILLQIKTRCSKSNNTENIIVTLLDGKPPPVMEPKMLSKISGPHRPDDGGTMHL